MEFVIDKLINGHLSRGSQKFSELHKLFFLNKPLSVSLTVPSGEQQTAGPPNYSFASILKHSSIMEKNSFPNEYESKHKSCFFCCRPEMSML